MRRIREVLRLKHECALPNAQIAAALGIAKGSVANYLAAATAAGFTDAGQIGPFLRTFIALHHDTLAVAVK